MTKTELNDWMTVKEAMEYLEVSRWYLYQLFERYQWRTQKLGAARLFHRADVEATPSADERKSAGYEQRSTRVESEANNETNNG